MDDPSESKRVEVNDFGAGAPGADATSADSVWVEHDEQGRVVAQVAVHASDCQRRVYQYEYVTGEAA